MFLDLLIGILFVFILKRLQIVDRSISDSTVSSVNGNDDISDDGSTASGVVTGCQNLRWFIGDFTLTPQYFESSLSVNCHNSHFHRLPTISLNRVCQ